MSNAIDGTNFATSRPFAVDFTSSSSSEKTMVGGSYLLRASQDCTVRVSDTTVGDATDLGSSQPAAAAEYQIKLFANDAWFAIDFAMATVHFKVKGTTTSGTLSIMGPIGRAANP